MKKLYGLLFIFLASSFQVLPITPRHVCDVLRHMRHLVAIGSRRTLPNGTARVAALKRAFIPLSVEKSFRELCDPAECPNNGLDCCAHVYSSEESEED